MLPDVTLKFTHAYRLLRKDGFDRAIRAEKACDKFFRVFFIPNDQNHSRLGIVISKKFMPNAVDRNYLKRIIREVFRKNNIKNNKLDLVVLVRSPSQPGNHSKVISLELLFSQIENKCAK